MTSLFRSAYLLTACSAVALLAPVSAQEADEDTITVVGIRQAYQGDFDPLEVPQAELTLDAEVLRNANALDLNDALDLSASVARQNNFGGLWNAFALRGFVGDANLPSNYLVNGFNAGRGFAGPRDLAGIESVEVLKGPRAALLGRGEPGGTINLVTKRPTFDPESEIRLSAGSFDTYRADADVDLVVADNIGLRLVGFYEDAESFRDTIETTKLGVYPSVAVQLTPRSKVVYDLEYTDQEVPFDRGVVAVENELGVIPIETFLGEPGNGPMDAEVIGHQFELQTDFSSNWSGLFGVNYRDTSLEGFDTAATLSGSRQFLFVDGENMSRERRFRDYDATYFVVRGEIAGEFSTGNLEHRILIGADMDEFENDQVFLRARGGGIQDGESPTDPTVAERLQVINIFDPVYGQFDLPTPSPLTDRMETQESVGIFIQDQISLTDRLDIRIGARYDDFSSKLNNRAADSVTEVSDTRVSPQFGIVYQVTDAVSLYAAYGENFRPLSGGLDPNTSVSTEAGVKFELRDGALVGTATVFLVEQENISTVDENFNATAIGEAQSTGFEFDLNGEIKEGLDLWFSYAYVDAQTENDFNDPDFGVTISAGQRLLNIPEHQLAVQLVKDFAVHGLPLRVGGGVTHVGDRLGQFGDFFGQGLGDFELPAYTVARAFAEYDLTEAVSLRADVDNLFDEEYYSNSYSQLWVEPGAPRNFRVSASFKF
ncbi:putative TonB-dependent receptor for ferrichrome transport [Parvularcula bermudensis HTCC2503]|uniref:Putative TonB-dependent receptor for ferrichrome transport n=1 Tax=Parvularcula bermudensis (strain ATCC BAA-594 / HTCC2503 / KCTC 12087) TaxID=314260 RepID=E0THX1_PARBH|nr:TonB-dependent siderophore receptor [Parvularcula bermudensis]ADM10782.1 putative TonB-dependent receptor for ferrichrome transport [Parvularcula bermudensis HTCC2503]